VIVSTDQRIAQPVDATRACPFGQPLWARRWHVMLRPRHQAVQNRMKKKKENKKHKKEKRRRRHEKHSRGLELQLGGGECDGGRVSPWPAPSARALIQPITSPAENPSARSDRKDTLEIIANQKFGTAQPSCVLPMTTRHRLPLPRARRPHKDTPGNGDQRRQPKCIKERQRRYPKVAGGNPVGETGCGRCRKCLNPPAAGHRPTQDSAPCPVSIHSEPSSLRSAARVFRLVRSIPA